MGVPARRHRPARTERRPVHARPVHARPVHARPNPPQTFLRDQLLQPPAAIRNSEGRRFLCAKAVKQLLTHDNIRDWAQGHPLYRINENPLFGIAGNELDTLIKLIIDKSCMLFAILVIAKLEYLTSYLLSNNQSDSSLLEIAFTPLRISHDENIRLHRSSQLFCPIFEKNRHLELPAENAEPFINHWTGARYGGFGMIEQRHIADGHLSDYNEKVVAVKRIHLDEDHLFEIAFREVETLRQRVHSNIIPLLASYTRQTIESEHSLTHLCLIFPWAEMNLKQWMELPEPPRWLRGLSTQKHREYLFSCIEKLVSALSYIHRTIDGTITTHHDLKPANILVVGQEMKIADFGHSNIRSLLEGSGTVGTSGLGTYEYQPPEYYAWNGSRSKLKHGRAFDIWSMGCIIMELATLIVYDWQSQKVAEFRAMRQDNPGAKKTAGRSLDDSFHNNWTAVIKWIHKLAIDDGSLKFDTLLDIVWEMTVPEPENRLYAWEAEYYMYELQSPDADPATREEKWRLLIQPPPPNKLLDGTQTPVHRAAFRGSVKGLHQLFRHGWPIDTPDDHNQTVKDILMKRNPQRYENNKSILDKIIKEKILDQKEFYGNLLREFEGFSLEDYS